jgi:hypothetical protein
MNADILNECFRSRGKECEASTRLVLIELTLFTGPTFRICCDKNSCSVYVSSMLLCQ